MTTLYKRRMMTLLIIAVIRQLFFQQFIVKFLPAAYFTLLACDAHLDFPREVHSGAPVAREHGFPLFCS